ncbi:hypothetical protein KP79_PYT04112 [Mizuhopecten yessoensis]|uniref:Uncharacterized protein n=1 Tax=Mizuhopecten yessoensis TaxID=6573 RepID=A0A210QU46_MIZYE|nr:hypothetical protein KP79_PYT04112 [Mizuhopecten yessoensis]
MRRKCITPLSFEGNSGDGTPSLGSTDRKRTTGQSFTMPLSSGDGNKNGIFYDNKAMVITINNASTPTRHQKENSCYDRTVLQQLVIFRIMRKLERAGSTSPFTPRGDDPISPMAGVAPEIQEYI